MVSFTYFNYQTKESNNAINLESFFLDEHKNLRVLINGVSFYVLKIPSFESSLGMDEIYLIHPDNYQRNAKIEKFFCRIFSFSTIIHLVSTFFPLASLASDPQFRTKIAKQATKTITTTIENIKENTLIFKTTEIKPLNQNLINKNVQDLILNFIIQNEVNKVNQLLFNFKNIPPMIFYKPKQLIQNYAYNNDNIILNAGKIAFKNSNLNNEKFFQLIILLFLVYNVKKILVLRGGKSKDEQITNKQKEEKKEKQIKMLEFYLETLIFILVSKISKIFPLVKFQTQQIKELFFLILVILFFQEYDILFQLILCVLIFFQLKKE